MSTTKELDYENKVSKMVVASTVENRLYNYHRSQAFTYRSNRDDRLFEFSFCGSGAELYIHTAADCIEDLDFMISLKHLAACDEFSDIDLQNFEIDILNTVVILKFERQVLGCPNGYVYLSLLNQLDYNWHDETFSPKSKSLIQTENDGYMEKETSYLINTNFFSNDIRIHGPAIFTPFYDSGCFYKMSSRDEVFCIRCLSWPSEAIEWVRRRRENGWPSKEMISDLVKIGCDLVPVAHRNWKGNIFQWRFSFSRAEVILARSWTRNQQTVYQMLRFFVKETLIKKLWQATPKIVCNYHIKTLLLWACEKRSSSFWTSNCVVAICRQLLLELKDALERKFIRNYFMDECNLFDFKMDAKCKADMIDTLQYYVENQRLAQWFEVVYMRTAFVRTETMVRSYMFFDSDKLELELRQFLDKFSSRDMMRGVIFHFSKSVWPKYFYRFLISNELRNEIVKFQDIGCAFLRLAWVLSNHEIKELNKSKFMKSSENTF